VLRTRGGGIAEIPDCSDSGSSADRPGFLPLRKPPKAKQGQRNPTAEINALQKQLKKIERRLEQVTTAASTDDADVDRMSEAQVRSFAKKMQRRLAHSSSGKDRKAPRSPATSDDSDDDSLLQ